MSKLERVRPEDISLNTRMYDEYIHEYNMDNGWLPGNQLYNFKALSRIAELSGTTFEGKTLLDVGCGTGDLVTFLKDEGLQEYVGVDIYVPSLIEARKRHENEKFIEGDILTGIIDNQFDFTICSGALTVKLSVDNYDFLESMVAKMWELSKIGVAFNVLTNDDPDPDHDLFFYDPLRVLEICQDIAPDAVIGAEETPDVSQIHVYMYRDLAKANAA